MEQTVNNEQQTNDQQAVSGVQNMEVGIGRDFEQQGYMFAKGMDRYNAEKQQQHEERLYGAAKEAAHNKKKTQDIVVKSLFSAFSGVVAGRAIDGMSKGAIAGTVAACGVVAWLGDYAYEYVIRKPIQLVKNAVVGCFSKTYVDPQAISMNVEVNTNVNIYDKDTLRDNAVIEKAAKDAKACDYRELAEDLAKFQGGVGCVCDDRMSCMGDELCCTCVGGCSTANAITWQTLLLGAAVGTSFISQAKGGTLATKIAGGVLTAGTTGLMSGVPYIAESSNEKKLDKAKQQRKADQERLEKLQAAVL